MQNNLLDKMQIGLMALERELAQVEEKRKQLMSQIEEQRGALRMAQMLLEDQALQRELLPHLFEGKASRPAPVEPPVSEPSRTPSPGGRA